MARENGEEGAAVATASPPGISQADHSRTLDTRPLRAANGALLALLIRRWRAHVKFFARACNADRAEAALIELAGILCNPPGADA